MMYIKRLCILAVVFLGICSPVKTEAISFDFINILTQTFEDYFSVIHFSAGGNNYPGALFVTNLQSLSTPQELSINGDIISCSKQLQGFYYNAQRGQRIRPLDETTRTSFPGYGFLSLTGGLFTTCSGSGSNVVDPFDVIGILGYERQFLPDTFLVAGGVLLWSTNAYDGPYASSLGFFNNQKPLGFLYDTFGNSGIGFVGGYGSAECYEDALDDLNSSGTVNTHFVLSGSDVIRISDNVVCDGWVVGSGGISTIQWNIDIKGGVGLSDATTGIERQSLVGNIGEQALLYNADFVNASKLLSLARKNASSLCRGVETFVGSSLPATNDRVICVDSSGQPFVIDLVNDRSRYEGKVIVVNEGDVIFQGSMPYDAGSFDLLVAKGNLLLENVSSQSDLVSIDAFGFPVLGGGVTRGAYIRANIVVQGILAGVNSGSPTTLVPYEHKPFIHGRFATLSTPLEPSAQRKKQLENLFGSTWMGINEHFINLQTSLSWRCTTSGLGNDGLTECDDLSDNHAFASLIVIKRNDSSRLLDR